MNFEMFKCQGKTLIFHTLYYELASSPYSSSLSRKNSGSIQAPLQARVGTIQKENPGAGNSRLGTLEEEMRGRLELT